MSTSYFHFLYASLYCMISGMSTEHTRTTKIENGEEKECLRLDFTNGSLQQLNELAPFLKVQDPAEVVKIAISYIQRLKDYHEKEAGKTDAVK